MSLSGNTLRRIYGCSLACKPFSNTHRRAFSISRILLKQNNKSIQDDKNENAVSSSATAQFDKKSTARSVSSKSSLRRIANTDNKKSRLATRTVTAFCTADKYNLKQTVSLLKSGGYVPDPLYTGLSNEVIHLRLPLPQHTQPDFSQSAYGDIFVFPSGNIVSWAIPESTITSVAELIKSSAENAHEETETEDLEFVEDPRKTTSYIRGDLITIGTSTTTADDRTIVPEDEDESSRRQATSIVLAKIAFSSGLARSTRLAVLESLLNTYLASTEKIPGHLARGARLPFTRSFILRKTGELLQFRAQLNLYSELTDNLPDIFWDSRSELGLEGYYDSVSRELDVSIRIRQLNEKLDYANEMAAVLRERLSERHGLVLEWMIILLIAVEVGFEVLRLYKERKAEKEAEIKEQNPPPPPVIDMDSDAADFKRIAQLQARIRARHNHPSQQAQHHYSEIESQPQQAPRLRSSTLPSSQHYNHYHQPNHDDVSVTMQYEDSQRLESTTLRKDQRNTEAHQRQYHKEEEEAENDRPTAAAADENFEYMLRRPIRMIDDVDRWLVAFLGYDIRQWGSWR